jgi:protein translocase SecG subunit
MARQEKSQGRRDWALLTATSILVLILDLVIIAAVAMQTTKHEGLSGVIGGGSGSRFGRKGGWDDLLERVTKYGAILWALVVSLHAWLWYQYAA